MRVLSDREQQVLAEGLQDWATGTLALQKQIERLRAALEEIARSGAPFDAKGTHSQRIQNIAIRALKDKPKP